MKILIVLILTSISQGAFALTCQKLSDKLSMLISYPYEERVVLKFKVKDETYGYRLKTAYEKCEDFIEKNFPKNQKGYECRKLESDFYTYSEALEPSKEIPNPGGRTKRINIMYSHAELVQKNRSPNLKPFCKQILNCANLYPGSFFSDIYYKNCTEH